MSITGWFCLLMVFPLLYLTIFGGYPHPESLILIAMLILSLPVGEHFEEWVYKK